MASSTQTTRSFRLPRELVQTLDQIAAQRTLATGKRVSANALAREAIERLVREEEEALSVAQQTQAIIAAGANGAEDFLSDIVDIPEVKVFGPLPDPGTIRPEAKDVPPTDPEIARHEQAVLQAQADEALARGRNLITGLDPII